MIDKTIKTYNRYCKKYDQEVIEFWKNFPKKIIENFCRNLNGKKILDLGSGSGRDAIVLKDEGLEITCIDNSVEMVKITKKLGFKTIKKDIRKINFSKNSFDGVWAYTSLLHVSKKEMVEVIKKINFILKEKGIFLIGMIEGDFEGEIERESMPGEKRYFKFYKPEKLKDIIGKIGFKLICEENYQPHSKVYLNQIYIKNKRQVVQNA
ncbi:MAG: class I SAM-dependent methyltransferase [Candidatus Shapirobacteria bacterium]|nr:class I SAM-dependent methyltransferase [Candidatus Shapirobacteria bacterium]